MKRRGLQLGPRHRRILYTVSSILLITGVSWAWMHRLDEAGELTEAWRRLKPLLLEVHGLIAVGFVLLVGTLLPGHVRRAWHARKNRANGAFFLTVVTLLTLSGYALYYMSSEAGRAATSRFHLWLGLAAPALLIWHVRLGRRSVR
jgi:hypothetical protein